MFRSRAIYALCLTLCAASAFAQVRLVDPSKANLPKEEPVASKPVPQQVILPATFGGWTRQSEKSGKDPAQFDAANAPALKEYGFTDYAIAAYGSAGHTVEVRAARFADAGGAFGTFTVLRQSGDKSAGVGDDSTISANKLLFYRGNVLVVVSSALSGADARALAGGIPLPLGAARSLPALPSYLPKQPLNSICYLAGPAAAAIVKLPLTPAEVRWDLGAEVVWAKRGSADLTLISYPTPQMAAARLRDLQAAMVKELPHQLPGMVRVARRSGPIVVWVAGAIPYSDAYSLARDVNYDAKITWDEPNPLSKRENVGNLIVAALALAGIVLLISLVAGVAFGGFRILMKRLYPDRVFDRSQDVEIIRLHLTE